MELQNVTREEAEKYIQEGGAAFFLMDKTGDTKTIWDPTRVEEAEVAHAQFDKLVGEKGYSAFRVSEDGGRSTRMETFDAKSGKIIFVPPMKGG